MVVGATVVGVVVASAQSISPPPRMQPHLVVVVLVLVVVVVVVVLLFPPKSPAMASVIHLYQSHLLVMESHHIQYVEAGGQRYQINIALVDSSDNFLIGADFGFVKAFGKVWLCLL